MFSLFPIAFAQTEANPAVQTGILHAILTASPVVQLTLAILIALSVISWSIIFSKRKTLKNLRAENQKFLDHFWDANSLDEISRTAKRFPDSNVAKIFTSGYKELQKLVEKSGDNKIHISDLENIYRNLRKASDNEMSELEKNLSFLATTGSTGPFIGLFGTVWGIMNAFQKIGQTGAASLAVVAPGISEALVATAIGLAAAIPAVVAYNHFNAQLAKEELEFNNFSSDLVNLIKRNFVQA